MRRLSDRRRTSRVPKAEGETAVAKNGRVCAPWCSCESRRRCTCVSGGTVLPLSSIIVTPRARADSCNLSATGRLHSIASLLVMAAHAARASSMRHIEPLESSWRSLAFPVGGRVIERSTVVVSILPATSATATALFNSLIVSVAGLVKVWSARV